MLAADPRQQAYCCGAYAPERGSIVLSTIEADTGQGSEIFTTRHHVVMFVDMVGASHLKNREGRYGDGVDTVHRHNNDVIRLIESGEWRTWVPDSSRHSADAVQVIKLVGDGVMVLLSQGSEIEAVVLGTYLVENLSDYVVREPDNADGIRGQVIAGTCVGLAAGNVLHVEEEAPPDLRNHFGRAVDIAARLANLPAASHVLMDDSIESVTRTNKALASKIKGMAHQWTGAVEVELLPGSPKPVLISAILPENTPFDLPMRWLRPKGVKALHMDLSSFLRTSEGLREQIDAHRTTQMLKNLTREFRDHLRRVHRWFGPPPVGSPDGDDIDELITRAIDTFTPETRAALERARDAFDEFVDNVWLPQHMGLATTDAEQQQQVSTDIVIAFDEAIDRFEAAYQAVCDESVRSGSHHG